MKRKKKSDLQKRKDKPNSEYWHTKAMEEWGRIIHLPNRCAHCGTSGVKLDAHHLITRAAPSCRYNPMNGILLCVSCHQFSNEFSAHGTPVAFTIWLEEAFPAKYEYAKRNRFYHPENDTKETAKDAYERLVKLSMKPTSGMNGNML